MNKWFHKTILWAVAVILAAVNISVAANKIAGTQLASSNLSTLSQLKVTFQRTEIAQFSDLALSPNGQILAGCGYYSKYVVLWNTRTGKLKQKLFAASEEGFFPSSLAFSPDGKMLVSATAIGEVRLWDVASGRLICNLNQPVRGNRYAIETICFSPDGKLIAANAADGGVRLWDVATGKQKMILGKDGSQVWYVAFSPDGRTLAACCGDGKARLWDTLTGKLRCTLSDLRGEFGAIAGVFGSVVFALNGNLIATSGENPKYYANLPPDDPHTEASYTHNSSVKVWDASTGKLLRVLPGHFNLGSGTQLLAFTREGKRLLSVGDNKLELWDIKTGKSLKTVKLPIERITLAHDGRTFAIAPKFDGTLQLWHINR